MIQEVFKQNLILVLIAPVVASVVASVVFVYLFMTIPDFPLWAALFFLIPIILLIAGLRTKLIVEKDTLFFQRVFGSDKAMVMDVAHFASRVDVTYDSDNKSSSKLVVDVHDKTGNRLFSFPANLIKGNNRRRFEEVMTSVNPDIKFGWTTFKTLDR
ncbi:hypothetical protein ACXYMX_14470 [Sporosarcina sp. CAU 1771]